MEKNPIKYENLSVCVYYSLFSFICTVYEVYRALLFYTAVIMSNLKQQEKLLYLWGKGKW